MKERIYLFDNLKCLLIILVVVGHFIDGGGRTNIEACERSLFSFMPSICPSSFSFLDCLQSGKIS